MRWNLLRHGQSTWNLEGRLQGQTMEVPLTELGLRQAAGAREQLRRRQVRAVLSSDQRRAVQTAEVVAEGLGLAVETTALLREQGLGLMEGRLSRDLRPEPVPEGLHISEVPWGGGESVAQVHARLRELVARIGERFGNDDELVLVSHGDTIRILLTVLAGRGHREVQWIEVGNCQVISRHVDPPAVLAHFPDPSR